MDKFVIFQPMLPARTAPKKHFLYVPTPSTSTPRDFPDVLALSTSVLKDFHDVLALNTSVLIVSTAIGKGLYRGSSRQEMGRWEFRWSSRVTTIREYEMASCWLFGFKLGFR